MTERDLETPVPKEDELTKRTRERVEALAGRSGFIFVVDPNGLRIPTHLSQHHLSLYKTPGRDEVISVFFTGPGASGIHTGSVAFSPVIADPFDGDRFIRNGPRRNYLFFTNKTGKTNLIPEGVVNFVREYDLHYPDRPDTDLVMAATDEPRPLIAGKIKTPDGGDETGIGFAEDDSLNNAILAAVRKHNEDLMLDRPLRRRTKQESEEAERRMLELATLLDEIDPERDLISPPSV